MDLSRFTEDDWAHVRARLAKREGNFTEKAFLAWLFAPGRLEELESQHGSEWTLSQALTMATGKKTREPKPRAAVEPEKVTPGSAIPTLSREEFEKRVNAKEQSYEDAFTDILPQDRAMIRSVAMTEVSIDELNMLLQDEFLAETSNADRVQKYGSALKALNDTHMRIQEMMGWDKRARDRSREERTEVEDVLDLIAEAGAQLEERLVDIKHTCGVLIGQYLTAFKEFEFEFRIAKCPLCGAPEVLIRHLPSEQDRRALEPEWVGEEEDKYRYALRGTEGE